MTTPRSPGRRLPLSVNIAAMLAASTEAMLSLPALRPAMIQTSLHGSGGGSRSAMLRKNAFSSVVISSAKTAFKTTRHGFHVGPRNQGSNKAGSSMAWMMLMAPVIAASPCRRERGSPLAEMILEGRGRGIGTRQLEFGQDATLLFDSCQEALGVHLFAGCEPCLELQDKRTDAQSEFYKLA